MTTASIIIPTLNESENIGPLLSEINDVLTTSDLACEIIVVDNGSTDGTTDKVEQCKEAINVTLIKNSPDEGLAKAVLVGVEKASTDNILVMDGDFSHPPSAIPELLNKLDTGKYDMVIGSRYAPGGDTPDWPLLRKLASKMATVPARMFTDVHDPLSGFFAVKKKFIETSKDKVRGFKLGFELLAIDESDFSVCEVPIIFKDRVDGESKMSLKVITEYFKQLVQLSGGDLKFASNGAFLLTSSVAIVLDFLVCLFMLSKGMSLATTHFTGFFVSCLMLYIITRLWHRKHVLQGFHFIQSRFLRILLVCIFIFSLRGGILAACVYALSMDVIPSFILVLLISHLLNYCANVFFVFPERYFRFNKLINWRIFATLTFIYFVILRFLYMGSFELLEEEAYYWNYSRHMDIGFVDHPPMVATLIWIWTHIFGNNEFGVRFGAFTMNFIAVLFVYRTVLLGYGRSIAIVSMLLMSIFPFYYGVGVLMTPDAPLTACWAGCIYFLYMIFVKGESTKGQILNWFGLGVCLGFGMLSKYTLALLGPAIVLFMIFDKDARKWFLKPHPYVTALFALALFSPVIIWNMQNEWASFAFQSKKRINDVSVFTTPELLGSILVLITPVAFMSFVHFLMKGRKTIAQIDECDHKGKQYLFHLIMTLAPLSVFTFFSITKEVKFNWTGPLWIAMIPYFAWTVVAAHSFITKDKFLKVTQKCYPSIIILFAVLIVLLPHYLSLGLPGVPFLHGPNIPGWASLVEQVEDRVAQIQKETGKRPFVIGMDNYQIASGLAFYRNAYREERNLSDEEISAAVNETSSWGLLGMNGLMYEFWFPKEEFEGGNLLLVATRERRAKEEQMNWLGQGSDNGEMEKVIVKKNGIPFGHYYFRYVQDYQYNK